MAQQEKHLPNKPSDLSLMSGTHAEVSEGELTPHIHFGRCATTQVSYTQNNTKSQLGLKMGSENQHLKLVCWSSHKRALPPQHCKHSQQVAGFSKANFLPSPGRRSFLHKHQGHKS